MIIYYYKPNLVINELVKRINFFSFLFIITLISILLLYFFNIDYYYYFKLLSIIRFVFIGIIIIYIIDFLFNKPWNKNNVLKLIFIISLLFFNIFMFQFLIISLSTLLFTFDNFILKMEGGDKNILPPQNTGSPKGSPQNSPKGPSIILGHNNDSDLSKEEHNEPINKGKNKDNNIDSTDENKTKTILPSLNQLKEMQNTREIEWPLTKQLNETINELRRYEAQQKMFIKTIEDIDNKTEKFYPSEAKNSHKQCIELLDILIKEYRLRTGNLINELRARDPNFIPPRY
jgi:hypothetical protein